MTFPNAPLPLYQQARAWLEEDWWNVEQSLAGQAEELRGKRILVTGAVGFLGFNFLHFFSHLNTRGRGSRPVRLVAADNYLLGQPRWVVELAKTDPNLEIRRFDVTQPWPEPDTAFDFIIHAASVASPAFYRKYPLETLDANVTGLRHVLNLGHKAGSQSLLYFSSSEIYGDPPAHEIPTKESYRGNVACLGPRACYDESKRLGETLCYVYTQQYGLPVKIVRPFNNYGPGLRLNDGRVLSDFSRDILHDRNIVLFSDGDPTRTFCYSSDALTGYLLALLSPHNGEAFNIGADAPEISISDLAAQMLRVAGSPHHVEHRVNTEFNYLTDNPKRRCPDISKARAKLGFEPKVSLDAGLTRLLHWHQRFSGLDELSSS
jgi:dTDP-glucose 4,6-dehydratase/UDP-glucuronate decarboxylase